MRLLKNFLNLFSNCKRQRNVDLEEVITTSSTAVSSNIWSSKVLFEQWRGGDAEQDIPSSKIVKCLVDDSDDTEEFIKRNIKR